ncbi:bacillithiol biosynthesis cysteine-adding enzyme BshC [Membranihabitans marinus]|uniref:bacillithiol biosynthesis cysteine-adding enzyme BshC n=1 Tax=Membranihabitans marinus TaxID=1227546 RepID=UPI001EFFFB13|nr:bacillithiol biosynthesis cysteine-adding enzyme BshC [Membranihabitans marinus]
MTQINFDFKSLEKFSKNDIAYAVQDEKLKPFYKFEPKSDNLLKVVAQRQKMVVDRHVLVDEIKSQYSHFTDSTEIFNRIDLLKEENVYTIITAHQPNLMTGPLYFVYKCLSAIKVSSSFNEAESKYQTIPVLILGGEDHDFDEMNHFKLFGKTITWEDEQGGPVSRYNTDSLFPLIEEVKNILGDSANAQAIVKKIDAAFLPSLSYGEAMQRFVHSLLGHLGILVVNMDNRAFKTRMVPYMIDDVMNSTSYHIVNQTKEAFASAGFDPQAHVREINFFYFTENDRLRIEKTDKGYQLVNGEKSWTEKELIDEIQQQPERFSPNVVLRPIYQEIIFPNLAYVGGGGEIAYWLERKSQFEHLEVSFPMLIRRDSFQLISQRDMDTLKEFEFTLEDLFLPDHQLTEKFLVKYGRDEIDLSENIGALDDIEKIIQQKVEVIDKSLVARIGAQFAKFKNDLNGIEKRLKKTEKQSHEKNLNKILKIKEKLYPGGGLQERSDNFMTWYILQGEEFFNVLLAAVDPFDTRVKTLVL